MGKAITEIDSYAGPMSGTTKLPVSDGDTLKTATASQVKTYIEGEIGTAQFRALLDDADAAAQRSTLGLGDAATKNTGTTTGTVAAGDHGHSTYAATGAIGSSGLTMATAKLLGRSTAGTGAPEEITLGTNLSFSGTTLNAAGGGGTPGGSDTQVQFNDGGSSFGGSSNFVFNKTTVKQTLNTGRKQLSFSNNGNDPVIAADGTGAVHLWVQAGSQYLWLLGGYGAFISNNDVNQACYISPSVPNSYIRDATGVGGKPGIGLSTYNVANLYIGACGRMIANDTVAALNIVGQASAAASTSNISGGGINITGGSGASGSSGAANGGSIAISGGVGYGTGTKGIVTASRFRADGFATATTAKTADYTTTPDDGTIEVDASGAARTITLFACSANAGKILVIKKTDSSANAVTIDGNASETIDGATTISLASQYSTAILQVNAAGTGWNKLAGV